MAESGVSNVDPRALAALKALEVLDTAPDSLFDALVRTAAHSCGTPISLVSLFDIERQWFKANVGLPGVSEIPRDTAFCVHVPLDDPDALLEVPDASLDPRFHDNPLVVGDPGIRFYAAVPLRMPTGEVLGTLCVIDQRPRRLDAAQVNTLRALAEAVVEGLVMRHAAVRFQDSEARYRALVEDQSDQILLSDADGTLRFVNAAYARSCGSTPEAMIGTSVYDHVPAEEQPRLRAQLARACASDGPVEGENRVVTRDGREQWFVWTDRALRGKDGTLQIHSVGRNVTERKQVELRLAYKSQRIENILDGTQAGTWEWNVATGELILNARWAEMLGYQLADLMPVSIGTWRDLTHPEDLARADAVLKTHLSGDTDAFEYDVRMRHRSGHWVWINNRGRVLSWDDGKQPQWAFGTHLDITERRRLMDQLTEQHQLMRVTLQSIGDAVITTDARGRVEWLNPVAERLTGWASLEAKGYPLHQVLHIVDEERRKSIGNPVARCLADGQAVMQKDHLLLLSRDAREYGIEHSASPIRDEHGRTLGAVLVLRDVSEQRRMSGEMTWRATHDDLTGLVNRPEFEAQLQRLLARAREDGSEHAMLYLDLDQFKLVNDTCGHAVGDQLLKQVSRLFAKAVRGRDILARMGGDEFAILLEHCTVGQAEILAQQICALMEDFRFIHEDRRFRVGASIGLVPVDPRWSTTAAIQQAADTACYAAKEAGRNRVHVWFDSDLAIRARNFETQWASRIESALDDHGFLLFAQQIAPIGRVEQGVRAEVLVRMRNADGTLVPAGAFLPAAERFNLVSRLDRWVLREVIDWLRRPAHLAVVRCLNVNLSGQSVGDRAFHAWALRLLNEAGPEIRARLCLEITETVAITNLADAAIFIQQVRAAGVSVALDDFGAGASSFGYLKSLPVDFLKMDGQFVQDLVTDPLDEAAVRCFTDVARLVGVRTVAEFVEDHAILLRLADIGVDFAQGYFIHHPAPISELLADPATRMARPPCEEALPLQLSGGADGPNWSDLLTRSEPR